MKSYRVLGSVTLTLLVMGSLTVPATLTAAGGSGSPDVTQLFAATKALAVQLRADSDHLDSFTRLTVSWESYSTHLAVIRADVNNAGRLLALLKQAESRSSPWQQATIKRIEPMLQEMATNLTVTIRRLNDNKTRVHFPEFKIYVKTNYSLAADLEAMLRACVDYGDDKARFESLSRNSSSPPKPGGPHQPTPQS
jgi:hypothetical protein